MPYGSGANWDGAVSELGTHSVSWEVGFTGSSSSIQFDVANAQDAETVAANLKNAWNADFPYEASIDAGDATIVRFQRGGQTIKRMTVIGTKGKHDLPDSGDPKPAVSGMTVKNVQ